MTPETVEANPTRQRGVPRVERSLGTRPSRCVLMLRIIDFAAKGAPNKSAQGTALGGIGIAVGVTRRPRGARRGSRGARAALGAGLPTRPLARPTGLPRSLQPQVSEMFVLAELTPNEGDLSVKHLGGVRRPAPSAGLGGVRRPAPSAGLRVWAGSGVATVTGFAGESRYGPCTHGPYPNTGDPRRALARSGDRAERSGLQIPRFRHYRNCPLAFDDIRR